VWPIIRAWRYRPSIFKIFFWLTYLNSVQQNIMSWRHFYKSVTFSSDAGDVWRVWRGWEDGRPARDAHEETDEHHQRYKREFSRRFAIVITRVPGWSVWRSRLNAWSMNYFLQKVNTDYMYLRQTQAMGIKDSKNSKQYQTI